MVTSESRDLPQAVDRLADSKARTKSLLNQRLQSLSSESDQRTRVLLGLLAVGETNTEELTERLLDAEPALAVAIAGVLNRYGALPELAPQLWSIAADNQQLPEARLRASVALAGLAPAAQGEKWAALAPTAVALLLRDVEENPGHFNAWVDALTPSRKWLAPPLKEAFADPACGERARPGRQYSGDVSE